MKKCWCYGLAALLVAALATSLSPSLYYLVLGLYRGEHFYRGRPTSYWREVIREQAIWEAGA